MANSPLSNPPNFLDQALPTKFPSTGGALWQYLAPQNGGPIAQPVGLTSGFTNYIPNNSGAADTLARGISANPQGFSPQVVAAARTNQNTANPFTPTGGQALLALGNNFTNTLSNITSTIGSFAGIGTGTKGKLESSLASNGISPNTNADFSRTDNWQGSIYTGTGILAQQDSVSSYLSGSQDYLNAYQVHNIQLGGTGIKVNPFQNTNAMFAEAAYGVSPNVIGNTQGTHYYIAGSGAVSSIDTQSYHSNTYATRDPFNNVRYDMLGNREVISRSDPRNTAYAQGLRTPGLYAQYVNGQITGLQYKGAAITQSVQNDRDEIKNPFFTFSFR